MASNHAERVLEAVRPLIEAGAALHWLVPFEKRPISKEWSSVPRQTEADLRATYRENANIGLRLGEPSQIDGLYLHAIDLDIRNVEMAQDARTALLDRWPEARSYPTVVSGSGGESRHFYFLTDKAFPKRKLAKSQTFSMVWDESKQRDVRKYDWEIDVLGTGSQVVIPPSIHPDTRQPYRWECVLDIDFPLAMSVTSTLVESWGLEAIEAVEDDEDDLFTLRRSEPMDLSDDEVASIISGLPADWVDDRDNWLTVGAALHHQYRGSEEGFDRWNEWASQSPKFDARDSTRVWRSYKGSKNPVRMATLIQAVNTNRLTEELDLSEDGMGPPSAAPSRDLDDLLAPSAPVPAKADQNDDFDPDWMQLFHRNEEGELKTTLHNIGLMTDNDLRIRQIIQFNEFRQEKVKRAEPKRATRKRDRAKPIVNLTGRHWDLIDDVNGDPLSDAHMSDIRRIIEAPTTQGGYGIKVSDRDLYAAVELSARKHTFHPIRERLMSLRHDGVARADRLFVDYLGCEDTPYHRNAAMLFLLGAVARIFQPGHKFDFVPILEGAQGQGKSTFIRILGLEWFRELSGDISKPQDAVSILSGAWILEIGELSGMHRAEVNELKAFLSRQVDTARMPYERTAREFPRQCVFMGSTNDSEYLRDITGGRRFWPIRCGVDGQIDNPRLRENIEQIWAETVSIYLSMKRGGALSELPLYMRDEAAAEALEMQESRRVETPEELLAGKILAWLEQPIGTDDRFDDLDEGAPKTYRNETCIGQIWEEMLGRDGSVPHTEAVKIGRALLTVGWPRSTSVCGSYAINKKYGRCRVYFRPGTQI